MSLSEDDIAYMKSHEDESMGGDVIIAASLGIFISLSGVFLRLLARRRVNVPLQADDWWVIVALFMDVWMKITAYWTVALGFGKHVIFVTKPKEGAIVSIDPAVASTKISSHIEKLTNNLKLGLVNELLWIMVTTPTKISVLCLYNRLFQSRALFRWSLFVGFVVSFYSLAYAIALGFQTIPFRAQWTGEPAWNCNINALIGSVAGLDVLTDVMIIASPIPNILKLNLDRQRKNELMGVFGVGAIVIVFGIVRAVFTSITPISDPTFNSAKCEIWSLLQPSIGILAACLPCLRPLLPRRLGGSAGTTRHGPAIYGSRVSKRRATLDYELHSRGKDRWRGDEETTRTYTEATQGSRNGDSPERGIRVDRDVRITYETNWATSADPSGRASTPAGRVT